MTTAAADKLRRFAVYGAVQAPVAIVLASLTAPWAWTALVVTTLPMLLAIGPFNAELAFNGALDDVTAWRWRTAFLFVPWSMTAYWWRWVRGRR